MFDNAGACRREPSRLGQNLCYRSQNTTFRGPLNEQPAPSAHPARTRPVSRLAGRIARADGCSCLQDPTNCCYKFGPIVETSEHCNAFVYYYPKADNVTCV